MLMEVTTMMSLYEISAIALSMAGGIFALYQWSKANRLKRAEFVKEAYESIRNDDEISQTLYRIDYGEDWYNDKFYENHKDEELFDKTFSYFNYLCYLRATGVIGKQEFQPFKYEIKRMAANRGVKNYFFNLYHFSVKNDTPMSFSYLLDYMKKQKLIGDDFWDRNSENYDVYLNI